MHFSSPLKSTSGNVIYRSVLLFPSCHVFYFTLNLVSFISIKKQVSMESCVPIKHFVCVVSSSPHHLYPLSVCTNINTHTPHTPERSWLTIVSTEASHVACFICLQHPWLLLFCRGGNEAREYEGVVRSFQSLSSREKAGEAEGGAQRVWRWT